MVEKIEKIMSSYEILIKSFSMEIWQPQLSMNESFWIPISSIVATIKIPNQQSLFYSCRLADQAPFMCQNGILHYRWNVIVGTVDMKLRHRGRHTKKRNNSTRKKRERNDCNSTGVKMKWNHFLVSMKKISGHYSVPLEVGDVVSETLWAFNN